MSVNMAMMLAMVVTMIVMVGNMDMTVVYIVTLLVMAVNMVLVDASYGCEYFIMIVTAVNMVLMIVTVVILFA